MTTVFTKRSSIKGGGHTCTFTSDDNGVTIGTCRCPNGTEWTTTADDADAVLAAWQAHRRTERLRAEGERLRALRATSGPDGGEIDVIAAAAKIGVRPSTIYMWEQGGRECRALTAVVQVYADLAAHHNATTSREE